MAYLNKVMLIGRLTDNPDEPKTLPNSGSTLVRFRFAVGKSKKDKQTGQWVNDPNPLYIDCEAYSKPDYTGLTDTIARYCQRGTELYVEGRLQLDVWDDKNNPGQKRSKHKLIVESVQFVGGKQENQQQSAYGGGYQPPQDNSPDDAEPPF